MVLKSLIVIGTFLTCIAFHALFSLWAVRVIGPKLHGQGTSWRIVSTMVVVVSLLSIAHVCEIGLWAMAMWLGGAVTAEDGPLYFAFTSYTTIGYGDVIAAKEWRLIGPVCGMNGVLLFGWSTAIIFQVLQSALRAGKAQGVLSIQKQ
jgi:hypothetical protein